VADSAPGALAVGADERVGAQPIARTTAITHANSLLRNDSPPRARHRVDAGRGERVQRTSAGWVEGVAEAVADEVDGEDRDEDREARRQPVPRVVAQDEQ